MQLQGARVIRFGRHDLHVPALFASYRLGDYPTSGLQCFPWEMTDTQALLINAYDLKRPRYLKHLHNGWDPETELGFAGKPILIDSGAYYFIKRKNIHVTPEEIVEIEVASGADVGVVLDHPFPPNAPDRAERVDTTVRNTEIMLDALASRDCQMRLMPVLHGHTPSDIRDCLAKVRRVVEASGTGEFRHIGIGSLAPVAQQGNMRLAVEIIHTVREELPDAHIHCFSMGSALLMLLAFFCGADSVDSQSWIVSAGFKYAQLPGHHVTRMAQREYKTQDAFDQGMREFARRLRRLVDEEGFFVKDWEAGERIVLESDSDALEYAHSLVDVGKNEHVHRRACHNLWVYNYEAEKARRALIADRLEEFVEMRLSGTKYRGALSYAKSKRTRVAEIAYS